MEQFWDGLIAFYGTNDLEKTDQFYRKILGLTLYKDLKTRRIYNVPGGGKLGFCSHMPVVKENKNPIITLLAIHVNEMYNRLLKAGITIPEPPKEDRGFKIHHFFIKDPNGYTVEICRFLEEEVE
ncbi:glyoxalase [Anoxybacter fermentans]|uniref:Glyoxalase n=1 Tax=Anoxybacter fermentans TaxID=1323375 RepID=A0A3Q9HQE8_9FIRM|nr:VOC family protein [Anoxybacter fermentans]AZR73374.1 glyoxalase [Anoxybacter fermentans]